MKKLKKEDKNSDLVTKDYLDRRLNTFRDGLIFYIDEKIKPFEEMKNEFRSFKDSVLKSLDWIMHTLKKMDEEHTILTGRYSDVSEKLDNHDERIKVLEKKSPYS